MMRLKGRHDGLEQSWRSFFDLYHGAIRTTVKSIFREYGWNEVLGEVLDHTISNVVVSFYQGIEKYDPLKGKLRQFFRQIVRRRVCDQLAKSGTGAERIFREGAELPDDDHPGALIEGNASPAEQLDYAERREYHLSLLARMLRDVYQTVSPQTYAIFEMCKLEGRCPEEVAAFFGVKRNVVDNAVRRVTLKLRELASKPEYRKEYFE